MVLSQALLDAQNSRATAQADRERQWRKEDMELAAKTLKAARGNTTAQWVIVIMSCLLGACSLALSLWNTAHSQQPAITVVSVPPQNPAIPPTARDSTKSLSCSSPLIFSYTPRLFRPNCTTTQRSRLLLQALRLWIAFADNAGTRCRW
jgi:hypothetical protein